MTEIRVKVGSTVTVKVSGPATIRITEPGADGPLAARQAAELRATMAGFAEAIALLTARHHGVASPGLPGDVPPGPIAAALVVLGGILAYLLPGDRAAALLNDIGVAAVREGGTPSGEVP